MSFKSDVPIISDHWFSFHTLGMIYHMQNVNVYQRVLHMRYEAVKILLVNSLTSSPFPAPSAPLTPSAYREYGCYGDLLFI